MTTKIDIIIDPEFKSLIPPLAPDELAQLEINILADGCRDPLVLWGDILIDGHNRYEICKRHDISFSTRQMEFSDRSHAIEWIICNQFGRRNLPNYERAKLALRLKETIARRAEANLARSGKEFGKGLQKSANPIPIAPIDTRAELARIAGVSHDTIAKVEKIEAKAAPALKAKLEAGEVSINQAYKAVVKEQNRETKKQETLAAVTKLTKTDDFTSVCDIRNCSMADLFGSMVAMDTVITDPPYPEEFLPLYEELAKHCAKAGVKVVAAMAGQSYLPHIYTAMSKHLKYRWTIAYMTPGGQAVQQWQAKANTFWKPVLLFGESEEWFGDVAASKPNDNDKRFHGWGQSESGMLELVDKLTKPGHLVCDPFVGGGTTAVACLALGRKFVGCDIDGDHVANAEARALQLWEALKCQ
jgi:16S rRNA G966 N2-methylase RsmD